MALQAQALIKTMTPQVQSKGSSTTAMKVQAHQDNGNQRCSQEQFHHGCTGTAQAQAQAQALTRTMDSTEAAKSSSTMAVQARAWAQEQAQSQALTKAMDTTEAAKEQFHQSCTGTGTHQDNGHHRRSQGQLSRTGAG